MRPVARGVSRHALRAVLRDVRLGMWGAVGVVGVSAIAPLAMPPVSSLAAQEQAAHSATSTGAGVFPAPPEGALLPHHRIVAYYGNPRSRQMGILGELPPEQMLTRLDGEVAAWRAADPATPVMPALHLVTMVAQADAGADGKYRAKMPDAVIEQVHGWAKRRNGVLFLDLQVGLSTIQQELPRLLPFLVRPDVHVGIDPEFSMKDSSPPGRKVGTYNAEDITWVIQYLAKVVEEHGLPPKVLVVHRFTERMVTGLDRVQHDPRVQLVLHMDGWGPPQLKRDSYRSFVARAPVPFTGFKVFYKNDTRRGTPVMRPAEILALSPRPLYIQYQ